MAGDPAFVEVRRDAGLSRTDALGGLTSEEAARLRERFGPNTVRTVTRRGIAGKVLAQLRDPMISLLLGAAVLTTVQGDVTDTVVILAVVLLNTCVGVVQEVRAERAVTALAAMAAPQARVLRDGGHVVLPTADVVPGDVLVLDAGDVVGADAEVGESYLLQADDSALTGESVPVDKPVGSTVFAGTTVTRGRGRAVVTGTGEDSSLGRIAAMVADARPGPTPMQRRLARLGRQLTVAAVLASAVVFTLSLARGLGLRDSALTAVSLAVAAVPESLPAVLTLSLALGAYRMARHHAIARELRAVETLGSVTLLATDKTGTLTENRMVVEQVWTPSTTYVVTGPGYAPEGQLRRTGSGSGEPLHLEPRDLEPADLVAADPHLARLLRDVALCNDADIGLDPDRVGVWRPLGDPTEAALVALARRGGVDVPAARRAHPRTGEVPFDSERAWMLTRHADGGGGLTVAKGAPEALLGALVAEERVAAAAAREWAESRAAEGFRVLAVLDSSGPPATPRGASRAEPSDVLPPGLRLAGLVAMTDPPRTDVAAVLAALGGAGIRVVVMTGDHPATADAVARRVGLTAGPPASGLAAVRTGVEIDATDPGELAGSELARTAVFARVRPEHKLALVQAWQHDGEVVAVTGDGVNDGPALRTAAIGVAMGAGGTEVARQAADLVLTDDRLHTVLRAVEEGRRIHGNLRRFLRYALSGGVAEVAYMLVAPLAGFVVPLLPAQILWVNMITHGLPGVAMGAEPVAAGAMTRPPIAADAPIIDRGLARRIALTGALIAAVTLVAAVLTRALDGSGRTSAFLVLGLAQLGVALALRDRGAARSNVFLTVAVAAAVGLQVLGVLLPPLQALLGTSGLPAQAWVADLLLALVPGAVLRLVQRLRPGPD